MKIILTLCLALFLTGCASVQDSLFEVGLQVERSLSNLEKKSIFVGDHEWVYLEGGDLTGPTVVLLHGFAAEKDNWTRMVRGLDGFHIIAPDLPGHGESSFNSHDAYGFDVQSLRLHGFIQALALEAFHLVGNSMGGGIAGLYAARYPQQVISLSLIDAVGFYGEQESEVQILIAEKGENPLIVRGYDDIHVLLDYAMHQPPFIPWPGHNILARRAMKREAKNDHIFSHIYDEVESKRLQGGFTKAFSQLSMPTYVIWGEKDRVLHVSSVDKFFHVIPDVRIDVLPNVGHAPMLEVPEYTAALLLEFWHSLSFKGSLVSE